MQDYTGVAFETATIAHCVVGKMEADLSPHRD